jgi:hypothetical protein
MKKREFTKVIRCPRCGTENIYTIDHDQFCMECDWDNSKMLVEQGQLDNLRQAAREQFGSHYEYPSESNLILEELPICENQ